MAVVRTNLVLNPSFEADTVGNLGTIGNWSSYGSNPTYKGVSADFAEYGSQSFKVSASSDTDGGIYTQITGLTSGQIVTASAYCKTDTNVGNANLTLDTSQHSAGGATTKTTNVGASNGSRVSVTMLMDATKLNIFIGLGSFGAESIGNVWWDGILLEITGSAGTYFDGNITVGGYTTAWTGTANASTSTLTSQAHSTFFDLMH